MRVNLLQIVRYGLLILVFNIFIHFSVSAQGINFVQITDPHLFDKGQDEIDNQAALSACIARINERIDDKADYKFAVVTGDMGIENLVSDLNEKGKQRILETDEKKREGRVEAGAARMASILSRSKIRVWLFLPGNNDLFNEEPNTQYYKLFIQKLRDRLPGMEIIDLCPKEPEVDDGQLGVYKVGAFGFVGFNNASFKNNNEPDNVKKYKGAQEKYVQQVIKRIGLDDIKHAYIFYHIPEVDDPYLVSGSDPETVRKRAEYAENLYPSSSWFVDKDIHKLWKENVVNNPKVLGLFAGHYHDWQRDTYQNYHWMKTADFLSGSLSKLYVCPPIAIKRQREQPSQARGFQDVAIDGMGRVKVKIFWLNSADQTFDSEADKKELESLKQLRLGEIYEKDEQFKEASDAYSKALNSDSTVTRRRAYDALQRVTHLQTSFWNRLFFTRMGWSLTPLLSWLLTLLLVLIIIAILVWYIRRRSRNRLGVEAFVDSTQNKQGAVFEEIIKFTLETMAEQQEIGGGAARQRPLPLFTETARPAMIDVPKLWGGSTFSELASKSLPAKYGGEVAAWFLRRIEKPEYSIQGSFQSDGTEIYVIVKLKRAGRLLQVWNPVLSPPPRLIEQQKDLALRVLIYLREYMINEHAR